MNGFTDIHSHFVYGVDDGAKTKKEMFAMLDQAYRSGIRCLYATPHVAPGMKAFDRTLFDRHLAQAEAYCRRKKYGMTLRPGAENLFTPQMEYYACHQQLQTMGDSRAVLVEFAPMISYDELGEAVRMLLRNGYLPIIAHGERYACLRRGQRLGRLKKKGDVLVQINAESITERQPFFFRRRMSDWLFRGLVDFVASDAHSIHARPFRMAQAYRVLKEKADSAYVCSLTTGAPE